MHLGSLQSERHQGRSRNRTGQSKSYCSIISSTVTYRATAAIMAPTKGVSHTSQTLIAIPSNPTVVVIYGSSSSLSLLSLSVLLLPQSHLLLNFVVLYFRTQPRLILCLCLATGQQHAFLSLKHVVSVIICDRI